MPLHRLCCKLAHYGICGYTLTWIKELLTGRSQQVVVNGKYSNSAEAVTSGVPQGSVLGPLLFICYINDIVYKISSTIRLDADDTLIYRNIHSEADVSVLQSDLNTVLKWAEDWQMTFNPQKTEFLRITNKHNSISLSYYFKDISIYSSV